MQTTPVRRRLHELDRQMARDLERLQGRLRHGVTSYVLDSRPATILSAPIIYSMVLPVALLDVWVTLFQWICFPLLGIRRVRRSRYLVIDRHRLHYLNGIEKLNCLYCGYANGVFTYVREVAGRTEAYWCPIRHNKRIRDPHRYYRRFAAYGDAEAYRRRQPALRRALRPTAPGERP